MEKFYINVCQANVYREGTFHSEIDTQALLWEEVQPIEQNEDFLKVRTEDDYIGWINKYQVVMIDAPTKTTWRMITAPHVLFYDKPDNSSKVLRDAVGTISIPLLSEQKNWYETALPDGQVGWLTSRACMDMPAFSRENLITEALKYQGISYFWGGKTPKGFDCSGFTQYLHKLFGVPIRRDAWMQFEDARIVSRDPSKADIGDLMYFAESGEKITHVGISLGNNEIIHARGMIRINSLNSQAEYYSKQLQESFVAVKTFF